MIGRGRTAKEAALRGLLFVRSGAAALVAAPLGFTPMQFFDLGESRAQVEQVPQVKF